MSVDEDFVYFDSIEALEAHTLAPSNDDEFVYFDSAEALEAHRNEPQVVSQTQVVEEPTPEPPTDSVLAATGKALGNVPERMEQSMGGLVRMAGEDMGIERERYIADRARRAGVSPDEFKLIAAAGQSGLFNEHPQLSAQDALAVIRETGFTGEPSSVVEPEQVADFGAFMGERARESMTPINVEDDSAAYYISSAVGSLAEMVPALAASIVSRKVTPALAVMSGQVGGQSYEKARQDGASVEDAQRYATGSVAAEVIPSSLPIGVALQRGKGIIAKIFGTAVAEGAQESITEAINIGLDQNILDQDITWGEGLKRLKDAGIIGSLAGGGTGGLVAGADAVERGYQKLTPERQFAKQLQSNINASVLAPETSFIDQSKVAQYPGLRPMSELVAEAMERKQQAMTKAVQAPDTENVTPISDVAFGDSAIDNFTGQFLPESVDVPTNIVQEVPEQSAVVEDVPAPQVQEDVTPIEVDIVKGKDGIVDASQGREVGVSSDATPEVGVFDFDVSQTTDPSRAQELLNSIREGELILKGGKNSVGKPLSESKKAGIKQSIESAKAKINALPKWVDEETTADVLGFPSDLARAKGKLTNTKINRASKKALQDAMLAIGADFYRGLSNTQKDIVRRFERSGAYDKAEAQEVVRAHRDYWNKRDKEFAEADRAELKKSERLYGKMKLSELEAKAEQLSGQVSSLQSVPEFRGDRRTTQGATSNEAARNVAQELQQLRRYIEHRKTKKPKKAKSKQSVPTTLDIKREDTFNATGNAYVPTYESWSEGLPDRLETIVLGGREHRVPRVQRYEPIHHLLTKVIGRRTYYRHIRGRGREGYYRPDQGILRTRRKNDVEVLAHEMAHYLDFYSLRNDLPDFGALYRSAEHRNQVMDLSYTDSNPDLQMIEGFAEFVRLWLTNSRQAADRAPEFNAAFNATLRQNRGLYRDMVKLRRLMHNFYYQGHHGRMEAGTGHHPTMMHRFDNWWYRRLARMRQASLDSGHAFFKAERELTRRIGPVETSAWKQFRLAKGGYREIAGHFMNFGTLNWGANGDLQVTGESLREVFAPIKQVRLSREHRRLAKSRFDLLMQYFKARRAIELHGQGRENQINLGDARKTVALDQEYPQFKDIFQQFQAFNKRMLDFYQSSGLVSAESRQAIAEMNKDYVPFHRIRETLSGAKAPKGGLKRLTGGTANTEDILINIQDSIAENVRAAMMNRSKQTNYQMIEGSQDGAVFAARIPPGSRQVTVNIDEMSSKIRRVLDEMGVETSSIDLSDPDLLQFWLHGMPPGVGDSGNLIDSVMIDGKTRYYEVRDPLMMEALQYLDPITTNAFIKVLHAFKNTFTRTVTLGLQFMGANFVMDTFSAWGYTKNRGYVPVVHSLMGMYDFLRKNENYQRFIRGGGGGSSLEALTRLGSSRRSVSVDEFGVMSIPDRVLSTIDKLATASEYGTRIAEFKLSKKAGKSDRDAAFDAREISTDYSVIGGHPFLANFYRSIHFFNAALQSMDRLYRELKTKRRGGNVTNFMVRGVLGVMLPTVMLYLFNREDETYNSMPVDKRTRNWFIPIGKYKNGNTKYFQLPRPYDAGHLFGSLPEIMVEYMLSENDEKAVKDFWWVMANMFTLDPTPSIAMGVSDIVRNKKWTGAPVVPPHMQNIDAKEQFTAQTSELFYKLGQATGMSPMQAEHMFRTSFGYLGGYFLYWADKAAWDNESFGDQPARKWSDNPLITRFLSPEVRPYIQETRDFFDLKQEAERVFQTFGANKDPRRAVTGRMGDAGFADDPLFGLTKEEKQVLYGINASLNDLTSQLFGREGLKTQELIIMYNPKLSDTEKREQIEALWTARNQALKSALQPIRKQLQQARKIAAKRKKAEASK